MADPPARPFLRRGPSGPLQGDEEVAGDCEPRFHEIYVDANTELAPEQQNGSLCFPYGSINAALASIPAISVPIDTATLNDVTPIEINCAPGVYDEDVVLGGTGNLRGRSITLRCVSGGQAATAVVVGPFTLGASPGLLLVDPTFVVTRSLTLDYSGLDGGGGVGDLLPYYIFESLEFQEVSIISDGDPLLTRALSQTWMDCAIFSFDDNSVSDKFNGFIEFRNTSVDSMVCPQATLDAEHSVGIQLELGRVRADKCIFDDLLVYGTSEIPPVGTVDAQFDLTDTMLTTSYDTFFGGPDILRYDSNTAYMAEVFGSIDSSQPRRDQDLTAQAYQHEVVEPATSGTHFMGVAESTVIAAPLIAGLTISLPNLAFTGYTLAGANGLMGRQVAVKNRFGSAGAITIAGSGGDTIEGSATIGPLAAGDGVILVPRTTTDWEVIATIP